MKFRNALCAVMLSAVASVALAGAAVAPAAASQPTTADRAFVREMISHHEMAVEMAKLARGRGSHVQIRRLARRIVSDQTKEIRELKAIARRLDVMPMSGMDHTLMLRDAKALGLTMDEMGMAMDMSSLMDARPFDRAFIDMMTMHHQGAIRMARAELRKGHDAALRTIARAIIRAQRGEVRQMEAWRKEWYGASGMKMS